MDLQEKEKLEKKYLPKKKVYLKLIVRGGGMVTDPKHIAYGGVDGAILGLTLAKDRNRGTLINPFESIEEQKFFEEIFQENLNVLDKNNTYWHNYVVKFIKDPSLIVVGKVFDMSNPTDALAIRVAKTNRTLVCEGWENRFKLPTYKYCIVEEGYEEAVKAEEFNDFLKLNNFFNQMQDNPKKMRNFLTAYYAGKKVIREVPVTMSLEGLKAEVYKVLTTDKDGYIMLVNDENYDTKIFISQCLEAGLITKKGSHTYVINGVEIDYNYRELVEAMNKMIASKTDPIYAKMLIKLKEH